MLEPAGRAVAPCCPPLTERPMSAQEAETAAAMFKALGDPVRLRLFSAVASHEGGEACVCDISDVGVSQPTVSHHLKKLKEAGLLSCERLHVGVLPGRAVGAGCDGPAAGAAGRCVTTRCARG
nr:Putative transcriptional regulator [Streptomyces sp. F8]